MIESTAAYQDFQSILGPTSRGILNDCVPGDPAFEGARCTNFQTNQVSGSHFIDQTSNSQRFTLRSQATLYGGQFWGANHQFKFGFTIENERFFRDLERRPDIGYFVLNPINNDGSEKSGRRKRSTSSRQPWPFPPILARARPVRTGASTSKTRSSPPTTS